MKKVGKGCFRDINTLIRCKYTQIMQLLHYLVIKIYDNAMYYVNEYIVL